MKPKNMKKKGLEMGETSANGVSQHVRFDEDGDIENQDSDDENSGDEMTEPTKWYLELPESSSPSGPSDFTKPRIDSLKTEASLLLKSAVTSYSSKKPHSISESDYSWIKTVLSKGTVGDKIAAQTLLIQDNPPYNLSLLKNLISVVKVSKNKECFLAVDTLLELFLGEVLPPERKLVPFANQPLTKLSSETGKARERHLILWYYEDQLKETYREFLSMLNQVAHDTVEANKEKAITAMYTLLQGHPEQESALLSNIVNKLGDPSHKIGSKVIYTLTKLLQVHPNMKHVVMEEVERVIFRANISRRAQYYSVCFLTQFILTRDDSKIANNLINIYFSLFKACVKTGDIDSRLMSALLTGVNRAYPFAKSEGGVAKALTEHVDTMYKVIHLSTPLVATNALHLLFLVSDNNNTVSDRFFSVLYKKIGEPSMYSSSQHAVFLSLVFKALKKDSNSERVCVFIKRLLQVCAVQPAPIACGILIIVSQTVNVKDLGLLRLSYQPDNTMDKFNSIDDDDEERYVDVDLDTFQKQEISVVKIKNAPESATAATSGVSKKPTCPAYDPYHRNPLHDNGTCIYTELSRLLNHYHPTVALFANNILNGRKVTYPGDPLQDFSLIRFLDKFVFKNPKNVSQDTEKNPNFSKFGRKKYYVSSRMKRLRANTADYLNTNENIVPVDEKFLYSYLNAKRAETQVKKEEDGESDADSVASEEFDEFLEGLMGSKTKEEEINFLDEAGDLPKATAKQKKTGSAKGAIEEEDAGSDDGSDDFDDDDLDEADIEGSDDDDLSDVFLEGSDLDEGEAADLDERLKELNIPVKKGKSSKLKAAKGKQKRQSMAGSGVFAAAEEFAELLEEPNYNAGMLSSLSNKDNADQKQIKWETKRNDWIQDRGHKRKNFGSKRDKGGKRRAK